jgi:hypothetical protein
MDSNLNSQQFSGTVGPLGNVAGQHDTRPGATPVGADQGQYVGKHRKPSERWNPQVGVPGFDESRYQSTWGSSPVGGGSDQAQELRSVHFSSLGIHDVWDDD